MGYVNLNIYIGTTSKKVLGPKSYMAWCRARQSLKSQKITILEIWLSARMANSIPFQIGPTGPILGLPTKKFFDWQIYIIFGATGAENSDGAESALPRPE